jgi:hypothetical protein
MKFLAGFSAEAIGPRRMPTRVAGMPCRKSPGSMICICYCGQREAFNQILYVLLRFAAGRRRARFRGASLGIGAGPGSVVREIAPTSD